MALLPKVKIKTVVSFPAAVFGGTGIAVRKVNGNFYFDLDYSDFAVVSSIPAGDLPNTNVLTYNVVNQAYLLAPYSSGGGGGGGGISEAPVDSTLYGRINSGWQRVPIGADAPNDGATYGRKNLGWVSIATTGMLLSANNLSDVANAGTSMRNLGGLDLSNPVSLTGTATLTSTAFGKLHLISGTSANYTITLPTPVGVAGSLIGFVVNLPASASKLYTLSTPSGVIGRQGASFVMWASETLLLRSDGTNWQVLDGRPNPFSGELTKSTNQTLATPAVFTEVTFNAATGDPSGLNLCYDGTRFVAPRAGSYLFEFYLLGTQTPGTYFQAAVFDTAIAVGLSGVFNLLGSVGNATMFGYSKTSLATGAAAKMTARADGTAISIAGATVLGRFSYVELPQW